MGNREIQSRELFQVADELEKAAAHCRISAGRFSEADVTSACAHLVASLGHIAKANLGIEKISILHSDNAQLAE